MTTTVSKEIQERVKNKLLEGISLVQQKYNVKLPYPKVTYDLRGTTAGTANYAMWHIRINAVLLNENVDTFIARTVPHELAHLACDKIYPEAHRPQPTFSGFFHVGKRSRPKREVHGPRWQEIMRALGVDDITRCHNYDVSNARVKKSTGRTVEWQCACGAKLMLTERMSQELRAKPGSRWHKGCRGRALTEVKAAVRTVVGIAPAPKKEVKAGNERAGTKMEKCANLYVAYKHLDRATIIAMFINEAGCTPAGAATYYATLKGRYNG